MVRSRRRNGGGIEDRGNPTRVVSLWKVGWGHLWPLYMEV